LAGTVAIATCHAMMTRNIDIRSLGWTIAIATTAASCAHSKVHWTLARTFRKVAPTTAVPNSAKEEARAAARERPP
jgi:hypothetical protein